MTKRRQPQTEAIPVAPPSPSSAPPASNAKLLYEGGHGLDPATGDENRTHSTENMIVTVAGRAGGFVSGQHIDGNGMHPVNVINSAMRAVGVDTDLGEVVGTLDGLI